MGFLDRAIANRHRSNHYGWIGAKLVFAGLGLLCVYLSGDGLYSHLRHGWDGTVVTATFQGWRTACQLEYVLAGEFGWKHRDMDCALANELVKQSPGKKVRTHRDDFLLLSYPTPDGKQRDTEIKRGLGVIVPAGIQIGDRFPVVYTPDRPTDVRTQFSIAALGQYLAMICIGLFVLTLVFVRSICRIISAAREPATVERSSAVPMPPETDRPLQRNHSEFERDVRRFELGRHGSHPMFSSGFTDC